MNELSNRDRRELKRAWAGLLSAQKQLATYSDPGPGSYKVAADLARISLESSARFRHERRAGPGSRDAEPVMRAVRDWADDLLTRETRGGTAWDEVRQTLVRLRDDAQRCLDA